MFGLSSNAKFTLMASAPRLREQLRRFWESEEDKSQYRNSIITQYLEVSNDIQPNTHTHTQMLYYIMESFRFDSPLLKGAHITGMMSHHAEK